MARFTSVAREVVLTTLELVKSKVAGRITVQVQVAHRERN